MVYKPPRKLPQYSNIGFNKTKPSVFLAGTIDMGNSVNWQKEFTERLVKRFGDAVDIFNSRRDDWDNSWKQSKDCPEFVTQVKWELTAMEQASYIVMNLLPGSASPVSLLETGIHFFNNKLMIHCPEGFYRKGNIDITCEFYDVPQYKSLDEIFNQLVRKSILYDKETNAVVYCKKNEGSEKEQ